MNPTVLIDRATEADLPAILALEETGFSASSRWVAACRATLDAPAPPNHALKAAFLATPVWDRT